ncbi:MAG: tail fiber domain-containing protein [Candidatus Pacebacteria bacterium]|nr:tail fiber domain-containing protein [Candidatus Paceibacterota bacterium]
MKIEINKKITVKKAAKERLNRLSRSLAAFVLLFSLIFSPFNSAFSFAEDNESSGFLNFKTGLNATAFFVFKTINSWFQISDSDSEQKKSQTEGSFLQSQTETIAEGGRATPALPLAPADSSAAETQISAGQKLIKKIAQLSPPAILPQALSVQSAGISQEELARELNILENSLKAEIYRMASQLAPAAPAAQTPASNFQAIALSQRIDNLDQVTISNATISKSTFSGSTGTITDLTATDLTATDFTTANLSASNNSYFTALSQGSIPFIGASGLLLQDNTNLFWDDTNNRLGLGTITPNYTLDVSGDIRTSATLYASTTEITNLTITTASSTQLTVSDKSWLGTVLGGTWQGTIIGDDYITKTGDWSGTVSGSYTGFGNDFYTYFNATSTNALAEGASNLYWTQNRWDQAMTATTTLPTITTLLNLTNASTTQLTVSDKSWIGTVLGGTWQGTSITDTYIDDDITLTNITQITSRAISDTSGTLLVGRGGTGLTTLTSGSILYADGDDNLTALASSTDGYVLVLDANGRPSWNDFTGTGKVVYDTSPTFTTGITVPADSISHTELSEGDAFTWTGSHSFSGAGDIDLPADSVDAGDVNFNYAASGSEGGSATSGDSASAFFSTGTIEHEYGGLQADVGSYAGLLSITGGATAQVDSVSELNALLLGESVASTTNVWADAYISSASTWNAKWDALSDISLAHKSIFVGDSSGHPVATSTITVLDSGFVGIGTTVIGTPNQLWSSGTPIVEIGGVTSNMYSLLNLAGKDNDDGANVAVITFNNMENSDASDATSQNLAAIYAQTETSDSNAGDDSGGHLVFLTKPEAGTAAERMRIDSDGNIGIGTTTPTALTHILQTGATDAFRVDDELADTSPFVIDDDGNVGIGTDSPTSKLHLPSENDETTPTLSFGDGDSGFYERNDDELAVSLGGVGKFYFGSSWVRYLGNGWLLKNSNTSSTNPAFSFEGDVDTGIGRAGANELSLITGATERIRIDNSGNVGIGTTTPQAALDIQKPATGDYLNISNDLHGDIVTVNSSGNLGIGTTAPTAKLDIDGTSKFGGIINTGGNWISGDGGAEGISVDSDGKVGIGTTEPEAKLHMKSASAVIAKFEGTGSNDAFLSFDVPATRNALMEFKENDVGKWYIGNVAANDRFEFHNGTSEVFSILSSGNVGIGTTSPSRLFHVSHATTNDVAQFESLDEKAGIILADPTGSVALETIGGDFRVDVTGDGNYEFYVKEDGNIGIGTTGPDEKLHVKGGVCITDSDTCAGSPGDGDIWILGNMSALSVTDRTPIFEGDALSEIKKIKGKDGKIDHSTLPEFVRAEIEKPIFEKREVEEEFFDEELNKTIIKLVEKDTQIGTRVATERNLGNMISMNVRAIQQLAEKMGNKVFKGDVINYNAGQLALENDSGEPQMKIAFDAENFAELQVNAVGDLTITTAGADLNLPNDNLSVCSGGACPAAARQMNGAGNLTVENTAFVAGALGVGTSSPDRVFNVFETAARPQMKISYDTDNYAELQVSAAGDLALSARGGDIRLPNENLAICSGGACPASAGLLTGAGNLTVENTVFVAGALGVGTARPGRALDVFETRTSPQMRISYDEDLYSELNVSATGDLIISARGGDVSILNENFKICSENGCPAEANLLNGAGNLVVENSILALGGIGINTASPSYTLDVNGTLRAYGITDASDERLKTNIQNLSELGRETSKLNLNLDVSRPSGSSGLNGTLAKINNLRGVTFHWRNADLGTARQIGLIAQELEIEYPELVSTDNKGFKSIQYGKFTAVLLEAVKELFSMSRTIEYRSANLENRTADLEKQNKLLAAKTEKLEERLRALEQILVQ